MNYERRFKLPNLIKVRNYNIVCITETWLNENISDNELHLDDYAIYRKHRISEGRNMDVAASIAIKIISSHKIKNEVDGSLAYEAIIEGSINYTCVHYNPPENNPHLNDVQSIVNVPETIPQNRIAMLCADLNLSSICWENWNSTDEYEQQVLNLFDNRFPNKQ